MDMEHYVGLTYRERADMPFNDYYDMVINKLGYGNVCKCIPFDVDELRKMYKRDKYMNVKMNMWRKASGIAVNDKKGKSYFIDAPLRDLFRDNGITCWSQSEGVCLLKRCAERMVRTEKNNE